MLDAQTGKLRLIISRRAGSRYNSVMWDNDKARAETRAERLAGINDQTAGLFNLFHDHVGPGITHTWQTQQSFT